MLNRPSRRNALTLELLSALSDALSTPDTVRALVLTGAPPAFSAGADLSELTGTAADVEFDDAVERTVRCIRSSPAPVVAAIDGPCIGAALELALACDVTVVGSNAFFEFPPLKLGILYNPAAIQRMHRRLPRATLARLLLAGDRLNASEAVASGVATHFASELSALELAHDIAERMAHFDHTALNSTRRLLRELDAEERDLSAYTETRTTLLNSPLRREKLARRRGSNGTA